MNRLKWSLLLFPFLLMGGENFQFSGTMGLNMELLPIHKEGKEEKPVFRFIFNPSWNIFGMPLSFNAFISSEENGLRQSLNRYRLLLQPNKLVRGMVHVPGFVFSISGIEIGTSAPIYSPYVLSGVPITGVSFSFNPLIFSLSAAGGRIQRAVPGSDSTDGAFSRNLYATRFGIGKEKSSHLFFLLLYSKDDSTSIPVYSIPYGDSDTVDILTPQEDYVLGINLKFSFFSDAFTIESEISGSQHTRDTRMEEIETPGVPTWLMNLTHPRLSSSFDYAYRILSGLNLHSTQLQVSYGLIGPGFTSFGAPNLRKDTRKMEFSAAQGLFDNRVSLGATQVFEYNNVTGILGSTTKFTSSLFNIGLNLEPLPYLQILFNPSQEIDDSMGIKRNSKLFSVSSGKSFLIGSVNNFISITYSLQDNKDSLNTYKSNNVNFSGGAGFLFPLNANYSIGVSETNYEDSSNSILDLDFSLNYTFFGRWSNGIGVNFSNASSGESKKGLYLNSSLDMGVLGDLKISSEFNIYGGAIEENNYNEWRIRANIRKSW